MDKSKTDWGTFFRGTCLALVLGLLLTCCLASIGAVWAYSNGWRPFKAQTVVVEKPVEKTQTVEVPVTEVPAPAQDEVTPGGAVKVKCGKTDPLTIVAGYYYHVNMSCPGCERGVEVNCVFLAVKSGVIVYDGCAWKYQQAPTLMDGLCDSRDTWLATLPDILQGYAKELLFPCAQVQIVKPQGLVPAPELQISPASPDNEGVVVAQGEGKSYALAPGRYYHLNAWWSGDGHEYNYVFRAAKAVTLSFSGTLTEFKYKPARHDVPSPSEKEVWPNDMAKLPAAVQSGVTQLPLADLH